MASIITEQIPTQGFEIVTNRLGVILLEELTNQKLIQELKDDFSVFIDRQEPFDNSEDVVINISLSNSSFTGLTQKDTQGVCTYFVDVYCTGNESLSLTGNDDVRQRLHLWIGLIRYILSSTKYQMLGLPAGLIGGKYVNNISFPEMNGNQDASYIRMARLDFSVRVQESQDMWSGIQLLGNDTGIKLYLTDKGYQLKFNN